VKFPLLHGVSVTALALLSLSERNRVPCQMAGTVPARSWDGVVSKFAHDGGVVGKAVKIVARSVVSVTPCHLSPKTRSSPFLPLPLPLPPPITWHRGGAWTVLAWIRSLSLIPLSSAHSLRSPSCFGCECQSQSHIFCFRMACCNLKLLLCNAQ
jgi:hypothetical protein